MTLELQNLRLSLKKKLYYYLDIEIEGSEFRLLSLSPAIFFCQFNRETLKILQIWYLASFHLTNFWACSMITAADVTPVLFFVNGVQITRRYDRKLDYRLQFYIQESPSLSVKFYHDTFH